jgi:enterochelin esterase-like enzyme
MKGSVSLHDLPAPSLKDNPLGDASVRRTPIYLPPGYSTAGARYPVAYFLHGFTGSGLGWLNPSGFSPNAVERLDALVSTEAIPPVIGVFLDGWTSLGGTQWINSDGMGRYGDYVAKDAVSFVDATFHTAPNAAARALLGKSSGGYGALALTRTHPGVFGAIGVHAGDSYFEYCYLPELPRAAGPLLKAGGVEAWFNDFLRRARETKMRGDDHTVLNVVAMAATYSPSQDAPLRLELPFDLETARLREDVWARWLEHDPVRFLPQSPNAYRNLVAAFVDCGARDEFNMRWGARMVAQALRAAGAPVHHEEFEDGHMGTTYRYEASLKHLVPKLKTGR